MRDCSATVPPQPGGGVRAMPASPGALVGGQALAAISRISAVASSAAPAAERMQEILEHLGTLIPIEGAMVSAVDPASGHRRVVTNQGYSASLVAYLNGGEFHAEMIEPFGLPRRGWPVRERDLPVDPRSLRCVAEYFDPAGLVEGLLSTLVTADGRYVGFIDISDGDYDHPSDEACAVVGYLAPTLANVIDPLQSARLLASTLADDCVAVGLLPDDVVIPLRGVPDPELLDPRGGLHRTVGRLLGGTRRTAAFLWPTSGGGWYACRSFRCRDQVVVLTATVVERPHDLTRRELEVLTLLVDGGSNAEIAGTLQVTARTVKAHVEHILEKLGIPTRAAAVGRAIQDGLLLSPEALAGLDSR
ncbi:response regulator transcription factor [Pseudonocardia bannensis]|uniref:Helix-turn-helix transcriptional regulator n=1 Tax=Pseudonocardia bannensis TaxID=630973 RepID=A0A848DR84_9PSEU|nr:helix-turn-helix transcriptional regulator [Pseudonocardia bannensis]NMH94804.1 helix-turn-helix transcriptional regulator [Pseudonocardia bannensis]